MKHSFSLTIVLTTLFTLAQYTKATETNILKHQEDGVLIWDASKTPGVTYTVYLNGEMLNEDITDLQLNVGQNAGLFAVMAVLDKTHSPKAFRIRPYGTTNVRIVTTKTTIETVTTITK